MTHETHPQSPDGGILPAVYALSGPLSLGAGRSEEEIRSAVDSFLLDLTASLRGHGCSLIGHIKGILEAGENGHLFFSVTSFEERTRFKGALSGRCHKMDLALNVIVYGVDEERINELVLTGLENIWKGVLYAN
jgi:hypothetical protein